jgi:hypothetical protein
MQIQTTEGTSDNFSTYAFKTKLHRHTRFPPK